MVNHSYGHAIGTIKAWIALCPAVFLIRHTYFFPVLSVQTPVEIDASIQCPAYIASVFDAVCRNSTLTCSVVVYTVALLLSNDHRLGPMLTSVLALAKKDGAFAIFI